MSRYRKILVAYDGSSSAKNALSLAAQLAREGNSWIKVLAVVPVYEGDLELIGVSNIKDTLEGPGKELLAEARKIADEEDVHILTNMAQGEPYEKIVEVAEDEYCDLIVIGRRGQSNLERELMGSVTARVIGHTLKDVLVVPEKAKLGWRCILLATDGSVVSQDAVEHAIELAKEHGSKLIAVTVVYTNDEFLALAPHTVHEMIEKGRSIVDRVRQQAEQAGVSVEAVVKEGTPHVAITKLAEESGADVIVMGSHGRKGLGKLLMGSVTGRTIGYSQCPVLVVH